MGAIVCGVIGAIAINLINKHTAKQQKNDNLDSQIDKKNEILATQDKLKVVKEKKLSNKVLQDFKEKLDKLEHLMDVDKAWELLEEQKKLLIAFGDYKDALSKIKHLKDVDNLWNDKATQANTDNSIPVI